MLPFTREQFYGVFVDYNAQAWPMQVVAYVVGLGLLALLLRPSRAAGRVAAAGLAALWAWTGVAYHALHFSAINRAAYLFAALFVVQALLLLYFGVVKDRLHIEAGVGRRQALGWVLIVYALAVYPLIGLWSGHRWSELPMFGITPCPLTIFTFGLLLQTAASVPRALLVVPVVWSFIGGSAAFLLEVPQDWLLVFSGIVTALALWTRRDEAATGRLRTAGG